MKDKNLEMIFKMKYGSNYLLILLVFGSMTSCIKTFTLQNGRTKVPAKAIVYKNKKNFDKVLLNVIDTAIVYEQFNNRYNVLQRLDNHIETSVYSSYRFYSDGSFNVFFMDREEPSSLNDLNPDYNGRRGVYYLKENNIRYDFFSAINQWGWVGKLTGEFTFSGDTLYVNRDVSPKEVDIYIKRKLPTEYFQFKANW